MILVNAMPRQYMLVIFVQSKDFVLERDETVQNSDETEGLSSKDLLNSTAKFRLWS
jgi:hypothetical protein